MFNPALYVFTETANGQSSRSPLLQSGTTSYSSTEAIKDPLVEQIRSLLSLNQETRAIKVVQQALEITPRETASDRENAITLFGEKVKPLFTAYYANYYGVVSYETVCGKPGIIQMIEDALAAFNHPATSQEETKDDLLSQVKKLINQNSTLEAIKVTKAALAEIKENKNELLTTVQDYQKTIKSLEKVKKLIAEQYQWFGFNMGKPPVIADIHKTIITLQEELEQLKAPAQTTSTTPTYQQP